MPTGGLSVILRTRPFWRFDVPKVGYEHGRLNQENTTVRLMEVTEGYGDETIDHLNNFLVLDFRRKGPSLVCPTKEFALIRNMTGCLKESKMAQPHLVISVFLEEVRCNSACFSSIGL